MLNYNTILSNYDDKLTLMQWLNKVEQALKHASATSFSVVKKGNATISFKIDFEDGTSLESGDIVLQQGESVQSAAIVDGHLILTLTNGDELDAGSVGAVSSFSINGSQHLIVTYQDGTTNDLGAIFNGNVNISGDLSVTGDSSVSGDMSVVGKINGGEIVETMTGYTFAEYVQSKLTIDWKYAGIVKNGNKLTLCIALDITPVTVDNALLKICDFYVPASILAKLVPTTIAGYSNALDARSVEFKQYLNSSTTIYSLTQKLSSSIAVFFYNSTWTPGTKYYGRLELTFLLSDNLAA